jgi:hypothetical protein
VRERQLAVLVRELALAPLAINLGDLRAALTLPALPRCQLARHGAIALVPHDLAIRLVAPQPNFGHREPQLQPACERHGGRDAPNRAPRVPGIVAASAPSTARAPAYDSAIAATPAEIATGGRASPSSR